MLTRVAVAIAVLLFVLALPPALSLSNLRWFVLQPGNYVQGQERNSVPQSTGLASAQLAAIDDGLVRYFQADRHSLSQSLEQAGVIRSPFSERDTAHLVDVHDLIAQTLTLHWLAVLYSILFLIVAFVLREWRLAARAIVAGSLLTVALLGLLGVLSLLDWDSIFLKFHFVSFSNDFWRLDPASDALIRLYPPGFFMDATIQLVVMSLGEAVALGVIALLLLRRLQRHGGRLEAVSSRS